MGLCLIAMTGWVSTLVVALEVALVLGLVIFVHELGHFVVAKLCGVKCEKFYLGFDIYGLKLCKFRWGETEYGVGILPLGGYVKMLGQEDNPSRLREEIERARQPAAEGESQPADAPTAEEVAEAQAALYDPRSYLAQSVPKRMAIISAGVIMNVIFAFLAAVIAFRIGVRDDAAVVGMVSPGGPAYTAGIEPGDRIVEIAGKPAQRFLDLTNHISLGDNLSEGVDIVLKRPGQSKPITKRVVPTLGGLKPTIGVTSSSLPILADEKPVVPGSPASKAEPPLKAGDKITAINGEKVTNTAAIWELLARFADVPIEVTIERPIEGGVKLMTSKIGPSPLRTLGVRMRMGEIAAVQEGSPAAAAGIKPGDILRTIDGKPVGDPMTLPEILRRRAGETMVLSVEREGQQQPLEFEVKSRKVYREEPPFLENSPVSIPQLGLAYYVLNRVEGTEDGTPAAASGLKEGDVIVKATLQPSANPAPGFEKQTAVTLEFNEKRRNWPLLNQLLQQAGPGSTVELTLESGKTVMLTPFDSPKWHDVDRGFVFTPEKIKRIAASWGEAVPMALTETKDALLTVVNVLRKVFTRQLSPRNFGGPLSILGAAAHFARQGVGELLIFVTLLSANLAVLNFLPIPVLDGGHMVFLAWEGIRGKPADERVQLVLTYIGLFLLLALMIWVTGLDLNVISREVPPK